MKHKKCIQREYNNIKTDKSRTIRSHFLKINLKKQLVRLKKQEGCAENESARGVGSKAEEHVRRRKTTKSGTLKTGGEQYETVMRFLGDNERTLIGLHINYFQSTHRFRV